VVRPDGRVLSWVNPERPGYAYPEIAGYLLSFLAWQGPSTVETRDRIARGLEADMSARGGVGRWGIDYAFDSAMALTGLLRHAQAGGRLPDSGMADRLYEFVVSCVAARTAYVGDSDSDPAHWSVSYGSHLLKLAIALTAYDELRSLRSRSEPVQQLVDDLVPLYDSGRFRVNELSPETYTHSHCYAIEGLITLDARGLGTFGSLIRGGADWLAQIQLGDGGMPSRHDGRDALGPAHTDCTAQAARIWSLVDRERYAPQISRAAAFLYEMEKGGAFRYRPGSDDMNTWATMFAAQAMRWAEDGGDWQWMV
jgi:hypothetical protein